MLSQSNFSRPTWTPWVLAIAAFWLSSNLLLDFLVMPIMYVSGMAADSNFAIAGYSLFWSFNRVELLCAAVLLTGILAMQHRPQEFEVCHSGSRCRWALACGIALLGLILADAYILAPQMSAMAFDLENARQSAFAPVMAGMHSLYWLSEICKLACLGGLAWLLFSDLRSGSEPYATVDIAA
ncbi:DUF4149 domain-containing protein [Leptolyngbya iicbica]|uniref:DUF4149 domain-containing protein n=2 Tax=Cyanophyceae TaxID=3028117 RepID=A0A4Q7EBX4_9CYAN|nr:DUF4149 domain-containing protein [Leptolyngbya sp. LK]RZM78735.1 DUF4149 domain-containing protein [Leptolyngbya sp. LK]